MNLISKTNLQINYTVRGNSDFNQNLIFSVIDSENNLILEKSEQINVVKEESYKSIVLDIGEANKGLLKIIISRADDKKPIVEEFFVYDSSAFGVTGFAFLNKVSSTMTLTALMILVFGVIAYFVVRRIIALRKWKGYS